MGSGPNCTLFYNPLVNLFRIFNINEIKHVLIFKRLQCTLFEISVADSLIKVGLLDRTFLLV